MNARMITFTVATEAVDIGGKASEDTMLWLVQADALLANTQMSLLDGCYTSR